MKNTISILFALCAIFQKSLAQPTLQLTATCQSIGATVKLGNYDPDNNASASVFYRLSGQTNWTESLPASRTRVLASEELRGSAFQLTANKTYNVKVVVSDPTGSPATLTLTGSIATRPDPQIGLTGTLRYVSPTGSGTAYTDAQPGKLETLLQSGNLPCGTTVVLKNGVYDSGDFSLNFNADCPDNQPVTFIAAPGATPVVDGSASVAAGGWTAVSGQPGLFSATLPASAAWSSLCFFDSTRLFPYPSVFQPPAPYQVHPYLAALSLGLSGFVREGQQVWLKTVGGQNPNQHVVRFSKRWRFMTVYGNGKKVNLRFKGIAFRYFGKPKLNFNWLGIYEGFFPAAVFDLRATRGVVFDGCKFWANNLPIGFSGKTSDNVVQNCFFQDEIGKWSHAGIKTSVNEANVWPLPILPASFGRSLETGAVMFTPVVGEVLSGNVVRGNTIIGHGDGVSSQDISGAAIVEHDISNNQIRDCFDGIEADGAYANLRIWGNTVSRCPTSISLAPPSVGPVYVFRNVLHHLEARKNYAPDDIFFVKCDGVQTDKIWATGLKFNGNFSNAQRADVWFVHNTIHAAGDYTFGHYFWKSNWRNLRSINNIYFADGGAGALFFDGVAGDPLFCLRSNRDNFFAASGPAATLRPVHGQNLCREFANGEMPRLRDSLAATTGSALLEMVSPFSLAPQFVGPAAGDYRLAAGSALINKGVVVPGLSHVFSGSAPDLGAFESSFLMLADENATAASSPGFRVFPSPSPDGHFWVESSEPLSRLEIFDATGRLVQTLECSGETRPAVFCREKGLLFVRAVLADGRAAGLGRVVNNVSH